MMAKDYFQDIVPPEGGRLPSRQARKQNAPPARQEGALGDEIQAEGPYAHENASDTPAREGAGRSIQNITPSKARLRLSGEMREPALNPFSNQGDLRWWKFSGRRIGIWVLAGLTVIALGIFGLFAFRNSTVTVTPRSQQITLDETSHFSASPEDVAATGTLSYKVIVMDFEDSEPVVAQGMQHIETKASGTVTLYNSYSASPVRLIKNTRFQTTSGLIFRAPADIRIPGKKGATPGSVNVTIVAEKAGDTYNVAPSQFKIPGLQSTPAMYTGISAKSTTAFSGGFIGDQPAVAPATLAAAISTVRTRLDAMALQSSQTNDEYITFPDLAQITYQSQPSTTEAGGGVRIHEKARVDMIAFPKDVFAREVAKSVTADAENISIQLRPGNEFAAHINSAPSSWGSQPIDFNLKGEAQLIWDVDTVALAKALSGRNENAFQTIVSGFPSIQEAHARIQPFWKSTFPTPAKIDVILLEPVAAR